MAKVDKIFKYGTFCSGIESPSVAWHSLGWQPQFFSEIEDFPCAVLKERFPNVPNIGDMTKYKTTLKDYEPGTIDLICSGTPCQSFSIAGLRKGMDDPRGNPTLTYLGIIDHLRPRFVVWENVPGVLSSNGGRDFASFLGGLGQLGYGWAYRVLDAQYIRVESHSRAVPQRRRRVFVVAYSGNGIGLDGPASREDLQIFSNISAAVLFERESLRRNPPPSRKTGQRAAGKAEAGPGISSYRWQNNTAGIVEDEISATIRKESATTDERSVGAYILSTGQANAEITHGYSSKLNCNHEAPIIFDALQITSPENRSKCEPGDNSPTLNSGGKMTLAFNHQSSESQSMNPDDISPSLDKSKIPAVFDESADGFLPMQGAKAHGMGYEKELAPTLRKGAIPGIIQTTIRRITPTEAERLQGFPDDYTLIPLRNKKGLPNGKWAKDSPRYKAIGNSMAVNVMNWIGQRIKLVDEIVN